MASGPGGLSAEADPPIRPGERSIKQIAALPYVVDAEGVRVLLITSRQTGRWVIPKGNPIPGLAPHEAAAQEAWEEAGVRGIASPTALGSFRYAKRRRTGSVTAVVRLFPLSVVEQHDDWPERGQRRLRWLPLAEAARAVEEPGLQALIAGFRAPPATGAAPRLSPAAGRGAGGRLAMRRWLRTVLRRRLE